MEFFFTVSNLCNLFLGWRQKVTRHSNRWANAFIFFLSMYVFRKEGVKDSIVMLSWIVELLM